MEVKTVLIVNAKAPPCWYAGLEGEVFEVYKGRQNYILKEDVDRGHSAMWRHMDFDDCEEID
jgi:hypothetical protein